MINTRETAEENSSEAHETETSSKHHDCCEGTQLRRGLHTARGEGRGAGERDRSGKEGRGKGESEREEGGEGGEAQLNRRENRGETRE